MMRLAYINIFLNLFLSLLFIFKINIILKIIFKLYLNYIISPPISPIRCSLLLPLGIITATKKIIAAVIIFIIPVGRYRSQLLLKLISHPPPASIFSDGILR